MTWATKSVSFQENEERDSFLTRGGQTKLFPREVDVHLEVPCSHFPMMCIFLSCNIHMSLLILTNGNFPKTNVNT